MLFLLFFGSNQAKLSLLTRVKQPPVKVMHLCYLIRVKLKLQSTITTTITAYTRLPPTDIWKVNNNDGVIITMCTQWEWLIWRGNIWKYEAPHLTYCCLRLIGCFNPFCCGVEVIIFHFQSCFNHRACLVLVMGRIVFVIVFKLWCFN